MRNRKSRAKVRTCIECNAPFEGKVANNSLYCPSCRIVLCMCAWCLSSFEIRKTEHNDGRGQYCNLKCYREHMKNVPPYEGKKHHQWKGGVVKQPWYGAVYKQAYRARKRNATGDFSNEQWSELKRKYNNMCLCCKQQEPFIKLTMDHIVPLSMGGSNEITNIQPLCFSCNCRKHAKVIDYTQNYVQN